MFLKRFKKKHYYMKVVRIALIFLPQNERRVLRDTIQMCMKPNLQLKNKNKK